MQSLSPQHVYPDQVSTPPLLSRPTQQKDNGMRWTSRNMPRKETKQCLGLSSPCPSRSPTTNPRAVKCLFHPPALPPPFPYLLRSDRFKTFRPSRTQGLDSLKSWQDGIHEADANSPRDELVGTGHGSPEAKAAQTSSSAAGLASWKQRSRTRRTRVRMSRPGHQRTQEASCLHGRKGGCFVDSRASSSSTSTTPFVPSSRQVASTPESRTSSFHSFKYPKILDKRTWPQLDDTKGEPAPPFIPPQPQPQA